MIPILTTNPRSGTHYLKNLLSASLGIPPLEKDLSLPDELRNAIFEHGGSQLIYWHFRFSQHAPILNERFLPDIRLIVLTRHPFDRLISQLAFTKSLGGRLPDPEQSAHQLARDLLLGNWDGKPWRDGLVVEDYSSWHNFLLRDLVTAWLENFPCHLVKFEDLVADPASVLSECLAFLGRTARADGHEPAIRDINFASLSGGRIPGEVDPTSHYRRGIPGEWKEVFSGDDLRILRAKYATEVAKSGYLI